MRFCKTLYQSAGNLGSLPCCHFFIEWFWEDFIQHFELPPCFLLAVNKTVLKGAVYLMLISQSVIINVERAFNTASQRKLKQRWYRTCKTRRGQKCRKLCTSTFFNTWPKKRERFIHSALLFERKWNKRRTEPDGLADKGNQGNGAGLCSQRWQLLEMCVIDYIYCFFLVQLQSGWGICIRHKCIGIISTHTPKLSLSSWIVVFSIAPPRPTVQNRGAQHETQPCQRATVWPTVHLDS